MDVHFLRQSKSRLNTKGIYIFTNGVAGAIFFINEKGSNLITPVPPLPLVYEPNKNVLPLFCG